MPILPEAGGCRGAPPIAGVAGTLAPPDIKRLVRHDGRGCVAAVRAPRPAPDRQRCEGDQSMTEPIARARMPDVGVEVLGRNRLLAALPMADFALLAPHLVEATLDRGAVLQESGLPIRRVYFPHGGLVSLLGTVPEGHAVDTATIGRE